MGGAGACADGWVVVMVIVMVMQTEVIIVVMVGVTKELIVHERRSIPILFTVPPRVRLFPDGDMHIAITPRRRTLIDVAWKYNEALFAFKHFR